MTGIQGCNKGKKYESRQDIPEGSRASFCGGRGGKKKGGESNLLKIQLQVTNRDQEKRNMAAAVRIPQRKKTEKNWIDT